MATLGFIGAGPVGTTFGVRLSEQGYRTAAVADISPAATERFAKLVPGCRVFGKNQDLVDAVDMVFITTADDFIASKPN
jgi:3-hydroxyisobutyrate dehydrogenase-like beta-hydroxyacid dehydrogenase